MNAKKPCQLCDRAREERYKYLPLEPAQVGVGIFLSLIGSILPIPSLYALIESGWRDPLYGTMLLVTLLGLVYGVQRFFRSYQRRNVDSLFLHFFWGADDLPHQHIEVPPLSGDKQDYLDPSGQPIKYGMIICQPVGGSDRRARLILTSRLQKQSTHARFESGLDVLTSLSCSGDFWIKTHPLNVIRLLAIDIAARPVTVQLEEWHSRSELFKRIVSDLYGLSYYLDHVPVNSVWAQGATRRLEVILDRHVRPDVELTDEMADQFYSYSGNAGLEVALPPDDPTILPEKTHIRKHPRRFRPKQVVSS